MFACAASAESELSSGDASEQRFICDWTQCGKVFSHPDNLRVHYRRHTDEKPHHCHHCEAAYRQKSGLKYHLEKVHGEKTVGRCGRKRKLVVENNGILASTSQIPSGGAFMSSENGELRPEAERELDTMQSITVNVKHTALSKVREIDINMSELQAKQRNRSDTDSTAEGQRWSLPESLSQDCDDNLDHIDINDEWLLDEEDGFITNHRKPPKSAVPAEEGEPAGSTSDTEPLDEDICEELRKLSDAINSEVLSPRGLDSMSPFDSPVAAAAYSAAKSDCIGNVLPDMTSPHPGLFQGSIKHEEQTAVFGHFSSASLPQDSNVANDFYTRHPDGAVTVTSKSKSTVLPHGQCNSSTSDQTGIVNGYLPDGYSCSDVRPPHFDRSASNSESSHLPVDGPEVVEPAPCHSSAFEDAVHPWPIPVNSPRWNSHSNNNSAFVPAHGIASVSARLSAETGNGSQICRSDGVYPNLMSTWSPAENSQHWLGHDGIIPNWSERQLATVTGQADVSRRHEWQMGPHPESPFSRSGTVFDGHVGFETGHQTSPEPCIPYRTDMRELPPMSDHFIDSLTAKHSGMHPASGIGHMGVWPDLYGRSSHMTGLRNYEYSLPRDVYRSAVQSDRFYLTSGYPGIQSHSSYERSVAAEGSYGISSGTYRIPPVHASSWPVSGLSDAAEALRAVPDAQQSSMLYSVVPRYY